MRQTSLTFANLEHHKTNCDCQIKGHKDNLAVKAEKTRQPIHILEKSRNRYNTLKTYEPK